MAVADVTRREALPADEFIKELEGYRQEFLKGKTLRPRKTYKNKEEVVEAKRKRHIGGSVHNHKFVAEKYLNCEDKELRRINLRKLVDECGQTSVGVGLPSHPRLARWGSQAFGLTDEEIDKLEKEDLNPDSFMWQVTKVGLHRDASWPIAIAMSMVGEGEKLNPAIRQQLLDHIEELKREYKEFGVQDIDKALAFEIEHADVDVDHGEIAVTAIRKYINTPELQDEMRRAYKLTLYQIYA